jgi:tetratricopeptide (TPR) repeat protein
MRSQYLLLIFLIFSGTFSLLGQNSITAVEKILTWVDDHGDVRPEISLDSLERALRIARKSKDPREETRVLMNMSQFVLKRLNNVERCSEFLNQIKLLGEKNNHDPWIMSRYHNGRGVMYYHEFSDGDKAFAEFKSSQSIIEKAGLKDEAQLLNNYALAFLSEQNAAKALKLFKKSEAISSANFRNGVPTKFLMSNSSNIGICYIYLNKMDSAEFYFNHSRDLARNTATLHDDFSTLVYLGVFYEEQGMNDKALQALNEAKKIMIHSKSWASKVLMCEGFTSIYRSKGDWKEAFSFSELSIAFSDSLRSVKFSEQAFAMDYKLEVDQLKAEKKVQMLEGSVNRQKLTLRLTLLIVLIVILMAGGGFIVYRLNKQKELNRIKAENEFLEKERIRQQSEIDLFRKEEELIHANVELNVQKNELSGLKNRLQTHLDRSHDPEFEDLKHFLKQAQKTEKKLEQLKYLDHVLSYSNSVFYSRLKQVHPTMTEDEMRLATLIRLNLSSVELVQVFNISMNSLMTKRYRMRKKLEIPKDSSLEEYIITL